jgi:hypothetical protein
VRRPGVDRGTDGPGWHGIAGQAHGAGKPGSHRVRFINVASSFALADLLLDVDPK